MRKSILLLLRLLLLLLPLFILLRLLLLMLLLLLNFLHLLLLLLVLLLLLLFLSFIVDGFSISIDIFSEPGYKWSAFRARPQNSSLTCVVALLIVLMALDNKPGVYLLFYWHFQPRAFDHQMEFASIRNNAF